MDIDKITSDIHKSFKSSFKSRWSDVRIYSKSESKKLAESLKMIKDLIKERQINEEQAKIYLNMHKNATKAVLITIDGLTILVIEEAINSALSKIKKAINNSIGFKLIL